MTQSKRCTGCQVIKPLSEFGGRPDRKSLRARCKECYREYARARYHRGGYYDPDRARVRYQESRDKIRAYQSEYAKRNRDKRNDAKHRRRSLQSGQSVSAHLVRARVEAFGGLCWICGDPYSQIDHVKPLGKGGPHMASNLRPACGYCNASKKDKWYGVAGLPRLVQEVLKNRD